MCEYLDYRVIKLVRTRIMNVNLDIDIGKHRELTLKEIKSIKELVVDSNKTID
jgi:23S rRNA pseudouridine2604 synthase